MKNKQDKGKTVANMMVISAVNRFKAEYPIPHEAPLSGFDDYTAVTGGDNIICTFAEFNQCIKEMSFHNVSNAEFMDYQPGAKIPLEPVKPVKPVKPRMKVEYVKVAGNDKVIAGVFSTDKIYYMSSNSHDSAGTQYSEITNLDQLACVSNIYRKVETEIKTEQRWITYDTTGRFMSSTNYYPTVRIGDQIIKITVDVERVKI